jgi:hypothetical protein
LGSAKDAVFENKDAANPLVDGTDNIEKYKNIGELQCLSD